MALTWRGPLDKPTLKPSKEQKAAKVHANAKDIKEISQDIS
jgi:hypothetical protein